MALQTPFSVAALSIAGVALRPGQSPVSGGLGAGGPSAGAPQGTTPLPATALRLETAFLTEMLRHAGFAERSGALGGKRTEDHMAPFLREAVAAQMSRRGSIGIAKMIAARLEEGAQSPSADPAVGSEQSAVGAMAARRDP